jgi:hypothetical protein
MPRGALTPAARKRSQHTRNRNTGTTNLIKLAEFAALLLTEGIPTGGQNSSIPLRRQQLRSRHKGPANLTPQPKLSAAIRANYLKPLVPWTMYAVDLPLSAENDYGLVSTATLEAYAAHFEVGGPWFAYGNAAHLAVVAPPGARDPLFHGKRRAPFILFIERAILRHKYEMRAFQYLAHDKRWKFRAEIQLAPDLT